MNEIIREIKRFNRFYTRYMGILNLYREGSQYSATEAMILYKIYNQRKCTAVHISNYFLLDKGYVSRVLKKFEEQELIIKVVSPKDRRIHHLELTMKGGEELNMLAQRASLQVEQMIEGITKEDGQVLIQSMMAIENILSKKLVEDECDE